jgi:nucleoside-diphosphate-sugar epimerase
MKTALVCGAGGFIGSHLVERLKNEGFWVRGVDLKHPAFSNSSADDFVVGELRDPVVCRDIADRDFDEVYQLAADMGGAGYLFTGDNDADVMSNSALINLNVVRTFCRARVGRLFFSSSACVYSRYNQTDPQNPHCAEDSAYPADPDSEYGWEKLFSERLYAAFSSNYGLEVRIARFHNVFGPLCVWEGGLEKAPAAICRKVAQASDGSEVEVWGDGLQTRSFLYVDECLETMRRFMDSGFQGPLNIGSEEMISLNALVRTVADIAGKRISIKNIPGPEGVRGRNSDNALIRRQLGWAPSQPLRVGLEKTYDWISRQTMAKPQQRVNPTSRTRPENQT